MGIQTQRMQISLECAPDAAGLPAEGTPGPPEEPSPKMKALIKRVMPRVPTGYHDPGCDT